MSNNQKSQSYFSELNYSLANEDTALELALVKHFKPRKVISVCGSGSRALPLLIGTNDLSVVDMSPLQISLCRLREESYKKLNYEEFLIFWGYPPFEKKVDHRRKLYSKLNYIDPDIDDMFFNNDFSPPIYYGKWEKTFIKISKILRYILGKNSKLPFAFDNLEDQKKYFSEKFPMWRMNLAFSIMGQKHFFNALLYKGGFVKKNIDLPLCKFYRCRFKNLFFDILAKENFFLQLCFQGKVLGVESYPVDVQKNNFEIIKEQLLESSPIYITSDIVEYFKECPDAFDFLSLSDVPSYFHGETEKNFLQIIKEKMNDDGIIVCRYYLRIPNCDLEGLEDITDSFSMEISQEKVQVYDVRIYRKIRSEL